MPCERVLWHAPSLPWKGSLLPFLLCPAKGLTVTLPSLPCSTVLCYPYLSPVPQQSPLSGTRLQLAHLGPHHPWLRSAIPNLHRSFFPPMLPYKKWLTCTLKIEAECSSKMTVSTYQAAMCHYLEGHIPICNSLCHVLYIWMPQNKSMSFLSNHTIITEHSHDPKRRSSNAYIIEKSVLQNRQLSSYHWTHGIVTTFMTFSWEGFCSNITHVTDISEIFYGIFLNLSSKSSSELQIYTAFC